MKTKTTWLIADGWLLIALMMFPSVAHADVPHLIRYQGQAVDSNGVPLEGPYTLTFRLYDAETGGTKIWEETQAGVALAGGHFSVLLGQVTPLASMDWSAPRWLSVQVNGEPELAPRQRITSVPLAIRAQKAEALTVPVTTSTITDDANKLVPSAAIILWDGAACPAGYTRLVNYDNRFLVAASTAGVTGGSNTHAHGAGSYTTGGAISPIGASIAFSGIDTSHFHLVTGTSATTDSRPEFMTILLCKKD